MTIIKILLIIAFLISSTVTAQVKKCGKKNVKEDLSTISKCKFNSVKKKPADLHRTQYKKKHKATKNNTYLINTIALKRQISKREIKNAKEFNSIDRIPTFKKCANLKDKKRLYCFNNKITQHIENHFHYPNKALINKIKGRVLVSFIIDKNGRVSNIKAIGPKNGELLIEEAKRVISNLPQFLPGKDKGKNISVKYQIPINFKLK